jgi:soluble lytic murein transglycosylase-like protein
VVYGMIRQESSFDLSAQSHVGARGLMQLMPATAREISRRFGIPFSAAGLDEPDLNVRLGTAYFRQMLDTFGGNLELALAGYNAGEWAVVRAGGRIPPFSATRAYVPKVLQIYNRLRPQQVVAEGVLLPPSEL